MINSEAVAGLDRSVQKQDGQAQAGPDCLWF